MINKIQNLLFIFIFFSIWDIGSYLFETITKKKALYFLRYQLDRRNLRNFVKKSKKLNDGVWKMRVNEDNMILCACMHTGVHVVGLENLESKL